jgi:hypothetical protein
MANKPTSGFIKNQLSRLLKELVKAELLMPDPSIQMDVDGSKRSKSKS